MNWFTQLFSRRHLYGELSEEIQEHLYEKIEGFVASGMPRKEAAAAARREFGNVTLIEEESHTVWRWLSVEEFFIDIRFGLRILRKKPSFTSDRKSTRLNSSHGYISYAVFCLKKKKHEQPPPRPLSTSHWFT